MTKEKKSKKSNTFKFSSTKGFDRSQPTITSAFKQLGSSIQVNDHLPEEIQNVARTETQNMVRTVHIYSF